MSGVFQRGAYYAVEVIPDEVAVISLNTMPVESIPIVVSGCAYTEPNDPGNLQIDWLEVQLQMYHDRGMQVWISGHVPPSRGNYFPECYVRYVELALRFQDTILGHLYGHMNVDHFFFLEAVDLEIFPDKNDGEVDMTSDKGLFNSLLQDYRALPKSPEMTDYAVVNVAPSVVPNPYTPAFRIFSYNVTGAGGRLAETTAHMTARRKPRKPKRRPGHHRGDQGNKTVQCESEEYQNTWRCHFDQPWNSDPSAPSRMNQRWTPLGYAQYFMPSLELANKTHGPLVELEYVTYAVEKLHPQGEGREFVYPVPVKLLPEELRDPGVAKSRYAPYGMEDLTIRSWIRLAGRLADDKRQKLRKRFRKYMYLKRKEIRE
ncbi:Endopolyphosphatase [Psilocybe cubensis]|uniref:Endopolyphosphatase n=1 Tax=Psilocybe cubensis TaxID=181762 RepID=A0ACB8H495_PSICU|nr:Endopolyphosphatase [Psilocybe cubensis]KAH9482671.1 Endopolyphosphatase [Psilocybe cubensis]